MADLVGWNEESRYLGLSANIREWNMGVYARSLESELESEVMKERVSIRQA